MSKKRLYYVDYCKLIMIMFVMVYHATHAYTNADWPMKDVYMGDLTFLYVFFRSFAMGMYFMLSGVFVVSSAERRSLGNLFLNKFSRLLLPVVFILFILTPFDDFIIARNGDYTKGFITYYIDEYVGKGAFNYGHGWFLLLLFIFIMVYALWAKTVQKIIPTVNLKLSLVVLSIAAITSGALCVWVRGYYPENEWVNFGIVGVEPAHFFLYVVMFILGIMAGKNGWFNEIPQKVGRVSIVISTIIAIAFFISQITGPISSKSISTCWNFLESVFGIFFSFAFLYLMEKYFNKENEVAIRMVDIYFYAYIIHVTVTVVFQVLFSNLQFNPMVKCIIVSILTVLGSFFIADVYADVKKLLKRGK